MTNDTSGPTFATPSPPFAQWSPSLRTWTDTGLWEWVLSLGTLPSWGCLRGGALYELPTPALPTVASGSSSLSLPTPQAADGTKMSSNPETSARRRAKGNQATLTDIVQTDLLPTPVARDHKDAAFPPRLFTEPDRGELAQTVALELLPTPVADHSRGLSQPGTDFQSLPNVAISLLPTPRGQDEYERRNHKTMVRIRDEGGDMTLPTWAKVVAPSLGADTPPPSLAGSESSDDPHQPPLFPA